MEDGGRNTFAKQYHSIVGKDGDMDMKNTLNPTIFRILENIKGKNILDLGCGNGYFSFQLEKKGAKMTGIDISSNLITFAKETAKKLKYKSEFFVSNATNLKILKNKKFDIVISNMAFMDIKDIKNTIKECAKHLIKNGLLLFSITNPIYGISERIFDKKQKKYYLKLEKYGSIYSIQGKNFGTIHHHRPIGFYLTTLIENNFKLTSYKEISTSYHQNKIMKDKALISYKKEIPSFLIIEAKKE